MGTNSPDAQQPAAPAGNITPAQYAQMQRLKGLQGAAMTPYGGGGAPYGGATQGAAQLVAALLARKKAAQLGIPTYNNPGSTPGAVAPGSTPTGANPGAADPSQAAAQAAGVS